MSVGLSMQLNVSSYAQTDACYLPPIFIRLFFDEKDRLL